MNNRKAKLEKALAYAAFFEGRKLAPLHAALLEAVEALEIILDVGESTMGLRVPNMNQTAREALAKIDKELEGMGGK